jgi:hypothetical protein
MKWRHELAPEQPGRVVDIAERVLRGQFRLD